MRMPRRPPAIEATSRRGTAALASVVLLVAAVASLTSGCDLGATTPTSHVTATTTRIAGFPPFADWRVLYADSSGRLHAVSTDGKHDVAGPLRLELQHDTMNFPAVSPDGRWLAYGHSLGVIILDLTGRHAPLSDFRGSRRFFWSPDSRALAVNDGLNVEGTVSLDGATVQIPAIGPRAELAGWVDSTHLAVYYAPEVSPTPTLPPSPTPRSDASPPPGPQTMTLAVQDIATGARRTVFSLTSSTMGLGYFLLAPDSKHALFYNTRWRDDPYTPDVRLIDMASGAATQLPHISQALGQSLGTTSIAWRAGTLTLAASTGFLVNGDLKTWVLDAGHDTVRALPYQAYVGGWGPDRDTLVLTTGLPLAVAYAGPFTLTAVAGASAGSGTPTTLTTQAYHLSFAGFARTSG